MPETVITERIGWERSLTVLRNRVRQLRPLFIAPDPAPRTSDAAGELAHCDPWFPLADIPLGAGQAGDGDGDGARAEVRQAQATRDVS